jgi:hypothetical protein
MIHFLACSILVQYTLCNHLCEKVRQNIKSGFSRLFIFVPGSNSRKRLLVVLFTRYILGEVLTPPLKHGLMRDTRLRATAQDANLVPAIQRHVPVACVARHALSSASLPLTIALNFDLNNSFVRRGYPEQYSELSLSFL